MAGHSKWSTIKRKKAANDSKRGKHFAKLIRAIETSARAAGTSDPALSPSLALAVQRARDASVPKDNIDRACKRGAGELDGATTYEPAQYEGYGPGGVAVLVDSLTDNRNRTASDLRQAFTKVGGSLAEPGSVAFQFSRRGQVIVAADQTTEDDLMAAGLDHGLDDVEEDGEHLIAWCDAGDVAGLRAALEDAGLQVVESGSPMVPAATVEITDDGDAKSILQLFELLEDNDDVQEVWDNADIDEDILATLDA